MGRAVGAPSFWFGNGDARGCWRSKRRDSGSISGLPGVGCLVQIWVSNICSLRYRISEFVILIRVECHGRGAQKRRTPGPVQPLGLNAVHPTVLSTFLLNLHIVPQPWATQLPATVRITTFSSCIRWTLTRTGDSNYCCLDGGSVSCGDHHFQGPLAGASNFGINNAKFTSAGNLYENCNISVNSAPVASEIDGECDSVMSIIYLLSAHR